MPKVKCSFRFSEATKAMLAELARAQGVDATFFLEKLITVAYGNAQQEKNRLQQEKKTLQEQNTPAIRCMDSDFYRQPSQFMPLRNRQQWRL